MKLGLNTLSFWFGAVMVLAVTVLAGTLLLTDAMMDRLSGSRRSFFIVLMLAYALYRGYRLFSVYKQHKKEKAD